MIPQRFQYFSMKQCCYSSCTTTSRTIISRPQMNHTRIGKMKHFSFRPDCYYTVYRYQSNRTKARDIKAIVHFLICLHHFISILFSLSLCQNLVIGFRFFPCYNITRFYNIRDIFYSSQDSNANHIRTSIIQRRFCI